MSVQALPQFTPAQVLDAGRRAEAEGRFEFAQQFYRHLVTYYAHSQEAAEAQDGLMRIGGHGSAPLAGADKGAGPNLEQNAPRSGPQQPDADFGGGSPAAAFPPHTPASAPRDSTHHEPSWGTGPVSAPPSHQHQHVQPGPNAGSAPMRYPPQGPPAQPPAFSQPSRVDQVAPRRQEARAYAHERDARAAFDLPPPVNGYRTGRIMARLCTWLGGGMALAGCAAVPISILSPRSLQDVPAIGGWLTGLSFGTGIIAVGLVMILLGQLMRALLDQANATRDLAAIARARAEHEAEFGRRRTPD